MAEQDCRGQLHACAMRLARLDTNGVPLPGAQNLYVTDALAVLTFTPVYTDGDETEDKNACGEVKLWYRAPDSFKRGDVSIEVVTPDPYLEEFLSGGALLTPDDATKPKGFGAPPLGAITGDGVSVEVWTKRIDDGDLDADWPYAHWAYPKVKNLRLGDHTHNASPLHPTFTGQAYENANWYDGPAGDWDADSDRVYQWIPANVLPAAQCGYQTLAAS